MTAATSSDADDLGTYHAPATTALVPGPTRFAPVSAEVAAALTRALGIAGSVSEIVGGVSGRFFRVLSENGQALFVKRVAPANLDSQRRSDELARWLAARGVQTLPTTHQFATVDDSGDTFFVYPWLDWRPVRATEDDVAMLGKALAGHHAALASHPDVALWRSNTVRRLAKLSRIRRDIADGQLTPRLHAETMAQACRRAGCDFAPPDAGRPLHGDLHLFNLLMPAKGQGGPVFIDFEDVKHSILPLRFELALVIERAILNQEPDDARAAALAGIFLGSYFEADSARMGEIKPQMPETLRALSLRSLCVIVDSEQNGIAVEPAEWDKFLDLFAQADRRAPVFA